MTCIVGFTDGENVIIGADSAATFGYHSAIIAMPKVFSAGELIIGFAGSPRGGLLMKNHLVNFLRPLYENNEDITEFMESEFPEAVRNMFAQFGHNERECGVDSTATQALIGVRGKLFVMWGDYSVIEDQGCFNAIGSGMTYAKGSLYTTANIPDVTAEEKLEMALRSACEFTITCREPFNYISTSETLMRSRPVKAVKKSTSKAAAKPAAKQEVKKDTTKAVKKDTVIKKEAKKAVKNMTVYSVATKG